VKKTTLLLLALCAAVVPAGATGSAYPGWPPRYGVTFDARVVEGTVFAHVPGSTRFFPIAGRERLPVGAILNANAGRVRLTLAKTRDGSERQTADFYSGTFRVLQTPGGPALTVLKLENGLVCSARTANRGLWGDGVGNFQTRGKHGSATVRGTIWWAQDTCEGTLFRVKRGVVTIKDFTSGKTLKLHAGQRYLAPNG
jgi:hypothetical protein